MPPLLEATLKGSAPSDTAPAVALMFLTVNARMFGCFGLRRMGGDRAAPPALWCTVSCTHGEPLCECECRAARARYV